MVQPGLTGSFMNNTCISAVAAYDNAVANSYTMLAAGFTGSVHTCLDFAVDGWTLWGMPFFYRVSNDADATLFNNTDVADNDENTDAVELVALLPFTTASLGDDALSGDKKAMNQGQVRTVVSIHNTTTRWHCFLLTSSEYFSDTPFHCIKADASVDANS